jgi:hypothetical protein
MIDLHSTSLYLVWLLRAMTSFQLVESPAADCMLVVASGQVCWVFLIFSRILEDMERPYLQRRLCGESSFRHAVL